MRQCTVDGCGGAHIARGYCKKHLHKFYRHGDAFAGKARVTPEGAPRAFLERALATETDDCILWPFAKVNGYATVTVEGVATLTNRFICGRVYGPAPDPKMEGAHSCNVRACINKRHLRWATSAENKADQLQHGTRRRGEKINGAKLTVELVRKIRALAAVQSTRAIANAFGLERKHVWQVIRRKNWAWVTDAD